MVKSRITTREYADFAGGVDLYVGPRQVADNESPSAQNCDFKGKGGVGNRQGYTQVQTAGSYTSGVFGASELHTSTLDQLIKCASDGANVVLSYQTNGLGAWNAVTGTKFTNNLNLDLVQAVASSAASYTGADGTLFSFNGTDAMSKFDGASWSTHTGGAILLYGAYFAQRLWGVEPTYRDTLKFSCQTPDVTASAALSFTTTGTSSDHGSLSFTPGAGTEITGLKVFKNALYVFTRKEIYSLVPSTSVANQFTITLVTATLGCLSHRSIAVVENDIFFASNTGVYSIGDVSTFTSVRGTNKSLRIQRVFDALSGANKKALVGLSFNYKYHLFYSQFGSSNDSCIVYDIRYQAWHSWTNMAANSATTFTDSTKQQTAYFGHPTNGKVCQLYSGTTDDGTPISSIWYSKSFDDALPDHLKLYFYSDFLFGLLTGSVTVAVIFNDTETSSTTSIAQQQPQGGFGQTAFGVAAFGAANDTTTLNSVINQPLRLKAKGQKFAIQYMIASTGTWRLDAIGQAVLALTPFKFPAAQRLN